MLRACPSRIAAWSPQAEEEKLRAVFSTEDLAARIAAWPNLLCARVLHAWWEVHRLATWSSGMMTRGESC